MGNEDSKLRSFRSGKGQCMKDARRQTNLRRCGGRQWPPLGAPEYVRAHATRNERSDLDDELLDLGDRVFQPLLVVAGFSVAFAVHVVDDVPRNEASEAHGETADRGSGCGS